MIEHDEIIEVPMSLQDWRLIENALAKFTDTGHQSDRFQSNFWMALRHRLTNGISVAVSTTENKLKGT